MANKRYDIMAPRKGRDKTFWHRIGTAWEGDKGIQLVFDSLPLPDPEGRVVANLFEPRDRDQQHRDSLNRGQQGGGNHDDLDDRIPF